MVEEDFREVVENHYGTLMTVATAYLYYDAEDAVAGGLRKAWEQRDQYDPERGSTVTFVCSRVKAAALNILQRAGAQKRQQVDIPDMVRSVEDIVLVEEALTGWDTGLAVTQKVAVALSALGFSNVEIGKRLGVSNQAISERLKRARKTMNDFAGQPQTRARLRPH